MKLGDGFDFPCPVPTMGDGSLDGHVVGERSVLEKGFFRFLTDVIQSLGIVNPGGQDALVQFTNNALH